LAYINSVHGIIKGGLFRQVSSDILKKDDIQRGGVFIFGGLDAFLLSLAQKNFRVQINSEIWRRMDYSP